MDLKNPQTLATEAAILDKCLPFSTAICNGEHESLKKAVIICTTKLIEATNFVNCEQLACPWQTKTMLNRINDFEFDRIIPKLGN